MNFILELPITFKELSKIILPVTGTLLGLVYTGQIYWLQSGIEKLEHSKDLLENIIITTGRTVLNLLTAASLVSLFGILELNRLIDFSFFIFSLIFLKDIFVMMAEKGYIATLFSTKRIPKDYGKIRTFSRKLFNAGILGWTYPIILIFLLIIYPVLISFYDDLGFRLTTHASSVFILSATCIALYEIRTMISQAVTARKNIEVNMQNLHEKAAQNLDEPVFLWDKSKIALEQKILNQCVEKIGLNKWQDLNFLEEIESWSSYDLKQNPVMKMDPWVKESVDCHFDIIIPYCKDDSSTRNYIFKWLKLMPS